MGRARNGSSSAIVSGRIAAVIGKFLFFLGWPLYLLLETTLILCLILFQQVGQLVLRRIPFLVLFIGLGLKLTLLSLYRYLRWFIRRPGLDPLVTFINRSISKTAALPTVLGRLNTAVRRRLPTKPVFGPLPVPRRTKMVTISILCIGVLLFGFWFWILRNLPAPHQLITKPRPLTTHIVDRNGKELYKIYRNQNRTKLKLADIPLSVQQATIAIEDAEFYSHPGFSLRGISRALERNLVHGELNGGSTITQQLVKNALLSPEKTYRRKIREVILALWTELTFSKDEILEMYLNEISYGGTAYGIEEAAQLYFGKPAKELTLAQASLLAGLTAAPTHYSPFGANPDLAKMRQQLVLSRMAQEGFITPQEAQRAQEEPLVYAPLGTEIKAAHFVMWIKQQLVDQFGERMVEEGGLTVVTSLDLSLQQQAEQIVKGEVAKLAGYHVTNGAALVTDPPTGEILAMVGSADYFGRGGGNYNVTTALRQPGSAIKPVNYAYALGHGWTPASIIQDTPISFTNAPRPYTPENYDGKFRGNVPLRTALGSSLNVPAVKVLNSYGVDKMIEQGKKMGITSWDDPSRFGLALTLGGGEVKMTDMAVVYGTLANYGTRVPLKSVLTVTDGNKKELINQRCGRQFSFLHRLEKNVYASMALGAESPCQKEQVIDQRIAFLITDILHDNAARTPAFGPNSLLVIPNHPEIAVKTGTTQNLRDNWAIGYNQNYLVLTWVGNNDNSPMSKVASGVTGATPIWHDLISLLTANQPGRQWEIPAGVVKTVICPYTATLPCEGCPGREEWFLEENQPKNRCNLQPILEQISQEQQNLSDQEKHQRILEQLQNPRN